ncbi:CRP/FNR family transcriptional regulator [Pseudorhizobium tarimense]|uniref:CRP/FNR family transcriptional regulator n=1 Tax=Pseudorhizobium tarimense TaxID=1079109 RepID=A0ABV2H712_9HYPH|nr:Crp/Fnr family transcriptional regulator [Pseudorhizobium tarimense]MCJ8519359.1 Crp/Fnr family transcriptional regulator [Pseudorhizobium tarimense]
MSGWLKSAVFPASLEKEARALLEGIRPVQMRRGTVLFRPIDRSQAFIVVLSGRVDVYLTGRTGREMLLYSVPPGETCGQTTLGVFADAAYTSEAIAESNLVITMVPESAFEKLLAGSAAFRAFVFMALAARLKEMMNLLEQVAFTGIEERLARALLDR